jgi:hypothetical protein
MRKIIITADDPQREAIVRQLVEQASNLVEKLPFESFEDLQGPEEGITNIMA